MLEKAPKFEIDPVKKMEDEMRARAVEGDLTQVNKEPKKESQPLSTKEQVPSSEQVDLEAIVKNLRNLEGLSFSTAAQLIRGGYIEEVIQELDSHPTAFDKFHIPNILKYIVDTNNDVYFGERVGALIMLNCASSTDLFNQLFSRIKDTDALFGNPEFLDRFVRSLHNTRSFNYDIAQKLCEKGYTDNVIASIDKCTAGAERKKQLVFEALNRGHGQVVIHHLLKCIETAEIDPHELAKELLEKGYLNHLVLEVNYRSRELEDIVIQEILNLNNKEAADLIMATCKERQGISKEIVEQLLERGYATSVFRYRKSFADLDLLNIISSLPEERQPSALLEVLPDMRHLAIEYAEKLITAGFGGAVAERITSFEAMDGQHDQIAQQLIELGYAQEVERHISKFSGIEPEIIEKLLESLLGKSSIVDTIKYKISRKTDRRIDNLIFEIARFNGLSAITAELLIQAGYLETVKLYEKNFDALPNRAAGYFFDHDSKISSLDGIHKPGVYTADSFVRLEVERLILKFHNLSYFQAKDFIDYGIFSIVIENINHFDKRDHDRIASLIMKKEEQRQYHRQSDFFNFFLTKQKTIDKVNKILDKEGSSHWKYLGE